MPPPTATAAPTTTAAPPRPQITAINLRALQRSDPSITRIIAQTAYVVAYRERQEEEEGQSAGHAGKGQSEGREQGEGGTDGVNKWEKMGVEGTLFVYESSSPPHSGILILNRNGIHNYQKPVVPHYTDITVDGSWVYLWGVDMADLGGVVRSLVDGAGIGTTATATAAGDQPSRRPNRRSRITKPQSSTTTSTSTPTTPQTTSSQLSTAPPSQAPVRPTTHVRKTRVALYCHHGTESQGSEEARKLARVLSGICMSSDTSASQQQPQAQSQSGQTPSQSNPHQHPGIAQTTSAPVVPTVTSSPLPQQSQTNLQPPPQSQESSGMSMSDLLSKLSQTASPAPANAISQPFPGPPATGPGAGFPQPPMNGGGQHLYPGNGVPDTLHHSNSWSVGQIPSPHPHHMGGTASPQRGPAYPHPMAGHSSPRPQNFPPSSGTHHAADLTASLKQMLGLGAAASPNRAPSEGHINNTMTPGPQRNGLAHPMTPTRRFDDPRSFHHGATPPPIHLAPALDTMNARSRSPLQTPSLQQSTVSTGNLSQPPSRQLSQRQIQTNSPHNSFASPANAQLRQANQGYVPNPNRNGDPFAIGGSSGSTAVHNIDTNGVTNAVVDTWNNTTQKDGLPGNQAPNEDDKEQKRDFVRALLSAIHTDKSFVDQLWKEYCDSQRGRTESG